MISRKRWPVPMGVVLLGAGVMAAEWIVLVATTNGHEMLVGGVAVVASGVFLWHAHCAEPLRLSFGVRDVLSLWRVPWDVVKDAWVVTRVLVRDLAGDRAGSFYRVCGFTTAKDDPRMAARRVLATVSATASPNLIVVGVDYHQSRMLFHQVERSEVPALLVELGAKP